MQTKNVRHHLVETDIKCGRFRGDSPIDFIDEKTIEGTLSEQLEQALALVKRYTRQAIKITGKPERENILEYQEEATREAITKSTPKIARRARSLLPSTCNPVAEVKFYGEPILRYSWPSMRVG